MRFTHTYSHAAKPLDELVGDADRHMTQSLVTADIQHKRVRKCSHEANHGNLGCLLHHNVRRVEHGQQLLGGSGCSTKRRLKLGNPQDAVQSRCLTLPLTNWQGLIPGPKTRTCSSADNGTVGPWASSNSRNPGLAGNPSCAANAVHPAGHLPWHWWQHHLPAPLMLLKSQQRLCPGRKAFT